MRGTKKEERRKAEKAINDKREMGRQRNTAQTPGALASVPGTHLLINLNMYLELI